MINIHCSFLLFVFLFSNFEFKFSINFSLGSVVNGLEWCSIHPSSVVHHHRHHHLLLIRYAPQLDDWKLGDWNHHPEKYEIPKQMRIIQRVFYCLHGNKVKVWHKAIIVQFKTKYSRKLYSDLIQNGSSFSEYGLRWQNTKYF